MMRTNSSAHTSSGTERSSTSSQRTLPHGTRHEAHAAGAQHGDRQLFVDDQRGRNGAQQRKREAGGGDGHGVPGFAQQHVEEFGAVRGHQEVGEEAAGGGQALFVQQDPRLEFGDHQRRPQHHQRREDGEEAAAQCRVAVGVDRGAHYRQAPTPSLTAIWSSSGAGLAAGCSP
jgi:hypothetical protein